VVRLHRHGELCQSQFRRSGQNLPGVIVAGSSFQSGATCNFGAGITVNSCTFNSATQLTANITISSTATVGTRNVTVTNPDNQSSTLPMVSP